MKTIDMLLDSVKEDAPVGQILVGAFWTAVVLDTDPPRCGLASTLRAETGGPWPAVREPGRLHGRSGRELAGLLHSERILEASIGMAAFNALLQVDEGPLTEANAEDYILRHGTGKRVAIVGHFPFIDRVRAAAAECWVLELRPGPGDLPADQADVVLPQADVVALTGTSLLNHTFDDLRALCRPDAFVLLLGPSVPMVPLLFDLGMDALSGTLVDDPARVLLSVGQGASFRQIKRGGGLRLLTWVRGES
ncbi:MAG: Rossmann-like domain-containing protein [Anaerolineae bacterium]|jgi:uncharacterized protein (DUF4213/DUF364 family)